MKVLVVDDEKRARETILEVIKLYCSTLVSEVQEADGIAAALKQLNDHSPDLVLLDIRLNDGSGFDLIRHLSTRNIPVIFITAHEEYAIKAFGVSALDYLLKPIDPDAFVQAITRAKQKLEQGNIRERLDILMQNLTKAEPRKIALKTADSIHVVSVPDIIYCEADKNYTTFFLLDNRKIVVSKTLGEYEEILPPENFIRIHQSYIVNGSHVIRYDKGDGGFVFTNNDHTLPVSTRRKEVLMQFLQKL